MTPLLEKIQKVEEALSKTISETKFPLNSSYIMIFLVIVLMMVIASWNSK